MAEPHIRRKVIPENPVKVGTRFTRLIVIEDGWEQVGSTGYVADVVKVRCDCGTVKFVRPSALTRGTTVSCGCLQREQAKEACLARAKHGDAGSRRAPEYGVYRTMLSRCDNPNVAKYADYGGRGITVCKRWRGDGGYQRFLFDMGRRPPGASIERKDGDGPYSPENCRWATHVDQANNRRSSRFISYQGRRQTIAQWAREAGVNYATFRDRLERNWPMDEALLPPSP